MKSSKAPIIYAYVGGIVVGWGIDILADSYVAGSLIGIGVAFLWVSLLLSKKSN